MAAGAPALPHLLLQPTHTQRRERIARPYLLFCCCPLVFQCVQLLVAACQQEVQEIIRLTTNCSYTSLQFVAHSFEVMRGLPEANRVISRPLPHMGCDQAESFLLNYVEVLAGAASTWLLGAEYLAWCPVYGADALEAMLDTSPVSDCAGVW